MADVDDPIKISGKNPGDALVNDLRWSVGSVSAQDQLLAADQVGDALRGSREGCGRSDLEDHGAQLTQWFHISAEQHLGEHCDTIDDGGDCRAIVEHDPLNMRVTGHGTGQKKVSDCAGRLEKVFDNGARSPVGQMVNALRRRWVDDYCRPVSIKDLEQRFEIGCSQIDPAVVSKKTDSGSASLGERPLIL